ncbi:hypothetical protein [Nocardia wallacei]|uniref:hypothetical protein n=1 Tax=Nocardia wallacei TaxID=480035 RepID=UPI002455CCAF|nr:hypothetical protein [Nocardia wallacei]
MVGDGADDGLPDFAVVLAVVEVVFVLACSTPAAALADAFALMVAAKFGGVGQAQVATQHVDALLAA